MLNQETNSNQYDQEISLPLDESMAFNLMVWANSLLRTGNSNYQNEFYQKQATKISKKYNDIIG